MSLRKYIRRNVYSWHRTTSLIVAVPILLWTLSGFLHPVMNTFKPDVKSQVLQPQVIDTSRIKVSLQNALALHQIQKLHNFRIVKLNSKFYYQIQQNNQDTLTYIDCYDGTLLTYGDQQYAGYLAQRFLTDSNGRSGDEHVHNAAAADIISALAGLANCKPSFPKAMIRDITLIKDFNREYKSSNVLLPVYRVDFDRKDNIRLYIETSTDRLATAIDNRKAWFNSFFSIAHTWSFLDGMGNAKHIALGTFSALCLLTCIFGFYVYNIMNRKKAVTKSVKYKNRNTHRSLGNFFLLTTLLFSFSRAWHAFAKTNEKDNQRLHDQTQFNSSDMALSLTQMFNKLSKEEKLSGISVVSINGKNYWQLFVNKPKGSGKRYLDMASLQELPDGDMTYGRYLACEFSHQDPQQIHYSAYLNGFTHTYSMMNKRLPVVQVRFADDKDYFVETGTGYLSSTAGTSDRGERFSFTNLHMHHYWEMWLGRDTGKAVRNLVLTISTLGLLILALTGILMYGRKMALKKKT